MFDDAPNLDDELAQIISDQQLADDEAEETDQERNACVLSIRRSDGTEVVSVSAVKSVLRWSVDLQPGNDQAQNAYLGTPQSSPVWVNAWDLEISRDEDGTYFICID